MDYENIGLQAEAEGAAAEAAAQPEAGVQTGDAALRHLMEDMKVPRDKAEIYLKAKSRQPQSKAPAQPSQPAAEPSAADTVPTEKPEGQASRPSFEELIHDDEYKQQFQSKTEGIVRERVGKLQTELSGLREEREKLRPMLLGMAMELGMDTSDPDKLDIEGIVRAYRSDAQNYRKSAEQRGTDAESAMSAVNAAVDQSILQRRVGELEREKKQSAEQAMREQILSRHVAQLRTQEAELKKAVPEFSLEKELNDPTTGEQFRRLTQPGSGLSVQDAYRLIHWKEIEEARQAEANRKAMETVAASMARGAQRPRENDPTAGTGTHQYVPYGQRSKAELDEIKKRVKRGEKVYFQT